MATVAKYKEGQWVKLRSDERPSGWAPDGAMDRWMGSAMKISVVDGTYLYFDDPSRESSNWTFNTDCIERLATKEEYTEQEARIEEEKKERKAKIEKEKEGIIYKPKDVAKIAEDIFGGDRVYYKGQDVIIHFPVINITNSHEREHIIKDLYVKFTITPSILEEHWELGDFKATIEMSGIRGSLSLKEWQSQYGHSHMKTGNRGWGNFCIGKSEYSIVLQNVRLSLMEQEWVLLFLSLENYLVWESLEGGPYAKIEDLKYQTSINDVSIEQELNRIIVDMPKDVWDFTNGELLLIDEHPLLGEYFNSTSKIRDVNSLTKEGIEKATEQALDSIKYERKKSSAEIVWKGKTKDVSIYHEEAENNIEKPVSKNLLDKYYNLLSKKGKEFIKKYTYARAKQTNRQKVFG